MPLRDYQNQAIKDAYAQLRHHQSVMLMSPTGSGKTHIAQAIIKHGRKHGRRIAFIVDRNSLLDQTVDRFWEDQINIGVQQGMHPRRNPAAPVQVCSIQTLKARKTWPEADLVVVDEAHDRHQYIYEMMEAHPEQKFLGLSATPFTTGLGNHWGALVVSETTAGLMEQGYLSSYVAYGPCTPDLEGVKSSGGDYNQKDLDPRVREIAGKVCQHWKKLADDRLTLGFAVSVAHAKELAEEFQLNGIESDYVEGRDSEDRRRRVLADFKAGKIRVLFNVGVMCKGIDIPSIECLILARPTKSLSLHIQQTGRGLRTCEGKDHCLILDHAGNLERLGLPDSPLPETLCTKKKGVSSRDKREKKEPLPWTCPKCYHINEPGIECSVCGHRRRVPAKVNETEEKLKRITGTTGKPSKQAAYSMLLTIAQDHGYSSGWVAHKYRELFGVWPRCMSNTLQVPSPAMRSWVRSQQIRYAKRRQA